MAAIWLAIAVLAWFCDTASFTAIAMESIF